MVLLVRFGVIPEVARCKVAEDVLQTQPVLARDVSVVVQTHRGEELGRVLEIMKPSPEPDAAAVEPTMQVLRIAEERDLQRFDTSRATCNQEFSLWEQRIREWGLDLQLIDLERTLDEKKLVLYVLNERGPECTKLALQVAAAGLGIVEVQPVDMDGIVAMPTNTGACGSGGCGTGGCH